MKKFKPRKSNFSSQARLVPLIDVVFLLLIFFIMTVNFRQQEGFMSAELPAESSSSVISEVEPFQILVSTLDDGNCRIAFAGQAVIIDKQEDDFSDFSDTLKRVMAQRRRNQQDPVMLIDSASTSWQHMMNVYDALLSMNHQNIIFSSTNIPGN